MFISNSKEETVKYASDYAKGLKCGDVVCLYGDLGAGKTAFTEGVVFGVGNISSVSSPTFGIMNMYTLGDIKVYHFDLYRLNSEDELYDIGLEEYLGVDDAICIVEWPGVASGLIKNAKEVHIEHLGDDMRKITVKEKN